MGNCCKPIKKCEFKKTNKCKKPPVSTTKHYKSCTCLPEEKHCIVNKNFYDNHYKKCNHYYITDCNHITDHLHEYNIYHYDTKTTHEEKHTCEDIEAKEQKDHCMEEMEPEHHCMEEMEPKHHCMEEMEPKHHCMEEMKPKHHCMKKKNDCPEDKYSDYSYEYSCDHFKKHREDDDCPENENYNYFYKYDSDYCKKRRQNRNH